VRFGFNPKKSGPDQRGWPVIFPARGGKRAVTGACQEKAVIENQYIHRFDSAILETSPSSRLQARDENVSAPLGLRLSC